MQLAWVRYDKKKSKNYELYLLLGERGDKSVALKSSNMDAGELVNLRRNLKTLDALSLDGRLRWIRDQCPRSVKSAFRILLKKKMHILKTYEPTEPT